MCWQRGNCRTINSYTYSSVCVCLCVCRVKGMCVRLYSDTLLTWSENKWWMFPQFSKSPHEQQLHAHAHTWASLKSGHGFLCAYDRLWKMLNTQHHSFLVLCIYECTRLEKMKEMFIYVYTITLYKLNEKERKVRTKLILRYINA